VPLIIHAGTIQAPGAKPRHYYTDDRDALPASIRAYRTYLYDPQRVPFFRVLKAIRQTERDGAEVVWWVGNQNYETWRTTLQTRGN